MEMSSNVSALRACGKWHGIFQWARMCLLQQSSCAKEKNRFRKKGKNEILFILGFRVVVARICLPLCQCRLQSSHKLSFAIQTDTQKTMSNFTTFFRRAQCLHCPTNRFAHFMHTNYTRIRNNNKINIKMLLRLLLLLQWISEVNFTSLGIHDGAIARRNTIICLPKWIIDIRVKYNCSCKCMQSELPPIHLPFSCARSI